VEGVNFWCQHDVEALNVTQQVSGLLRDSIDGKHELEPGTKLQCGGGFDRDTMGIELVGKIPNLGLVEEFKIWQQKLSELGGQRIR
jgi:hypothetical protein